MQLCCDRSSLQELKEGLEVGSRSLLNLTSRLWDCGTWVCRNASFSKGLDLFLQYFIGVLAEVSTLKQGLHVFFVFWLHISISHKFFMLSSNWQFVTVWKCEFLLFMCQLFISDMQKLLEILFNGVRTYLPYFVFTGYVLLTGNDYINNDCKLAIKRHSSTWLNCYYSLSIIITENRIHWECAAYRSLFFSQVKSSLTKIQPYFLQLIFATGCFIFGKSKLGVTSFTKWPWKFPFRF